MPSKSRSYYTLTHDYREGMNKMNGGCQNLLERKILLGERVLFQSTGRKFSHNSNINHPSLFHSLTLHPPFTHTCQRLPDDVWWRTANFDEAPA